MSAAACPAPTLPAAQVLQRSAAAATSARTTQKTRCYRDARSPAAVQSRPRKSKVPDQPPKVREAGMHPHNWPSTRGAARAMHRVALATRRAAVRDMRATASSDRRAEALRRPEAHPSKWPSLCDIDPRAGAGSSQSGWKGPAPVNFVTFACRLRQPGNPLHPPQK